MNKPEITCAFRVWTLGFLIMLTITQCNYQNNTIAAIRAVGIQCDAEYRIEIPIEEVN